MLAGASSWLLFVCGTIALGLATAAVFSPRLHPIPFLLLAVLCFALSSQRFYHSLLWHPRWGPPVRAYLAGKGFTRRGKVTLMLIVFIATVTALVVVDSALVRGLVAAAALAAGDHVLSQPTAPSTRANGSVSFG